MAINFTPSPDDLRNMFEDWDEHPLSLQTELITEAIAQFGALLVDEIEDIIDAGIAGGATADELETWYITVVSGTTANVLTISNILNHAVATGSASTISNITSAVNAVYGTVVEDSLAVAAKAHINAALLTYNSNFADIGSVIGVSAATQIKDDLDGAIADLDTLIALL